MKTIKRFFLLLVVLLSVLITYNYPKLNIVSGYSSKYASSSIFVANRSLDFTDKKDLDFTPISLASDKVNLSLKSVTSSTFGLLSRTAFYREGVGSVLSIEDSDITKVYAKPNRLKLNNTISYPYGNGVEKDSIFSNIDYQKLHLTFDKLFDSVNKTRAALILYKGHLIKERYSEGFDKNSKILGWSMTKSITSTLFGILEHQKKINVKDKAPIKEWKNDERKQITIHNLLQMNSGLAWEENYNSISDVTKMLFLERDMTKTQIDKPLIGKPNESWNYSSGTTNVLSKILRQQFNTHQEYLDFWYTDLIDKIGMNSMLVETDLAGNYVGSSYAWATPRDWAKLGLLYLQNGYWNDMQLFTKDWVDYATTPTPTSVNSKDGGYGAQIWLNVGKRYPDAPQNMYSFNGYQGQNVFILPDQELVIVRMGLTKKANLNTFFKEILSSFK